MKKQLFTTISFDSQFPVLELDVNVNVNVYLIGHSPLSLFQDQYKQTVINEYSNGNNKVKNPNWHSHICVY